MKLDIVCNKEENTSRKQKDRISAVTAQIHTEESSQADMSLCFDSVRFLWTIFYTIFLWIVTIYRSNKFSLDIYLR